MCWGNADRSFRSWAKPQAVAGTAEDIAESLPQTAWRRLPASDGTKGVRPNDWAHLELTDLDASDFDATFPGIWTRGPLIRRNITDGDFAFFPTWGPIGISIEPLVTVEGYRTFMHHRWRSGGEHTRLVRDEYSSKQNRNCNII